MYYSEKQNFISKYNFFFHFKAKFTLICFSDWENTINRGKAKEEIISLRLEKKRENIAKNDLFQHFW